ncbi:uncharacterized protein LOC125646045 isoform X3 [Ostrea edulis]|uniref:uncharacterized protein LOC125646045 isoform X3 n=1 Tax=Ostrea edulis TaxID=37623 RepID=UPI0020950146|nr:uncharacterized protein LOC125646045 isoform X3 [Ostrea edulis]XP_055995537.1 uncharacterized protein LOC125646045 isoform X3 [Ostrea edulis]
MAGTANRAIYVYKGLGALEKNNTVLMSQLKRYVNLHIHSIQFISPEETIKGAWRDSAALYVIGGGYDLGLIKALGPEGGKIGPVYGPYKYNSDFGSRSVTLSCHIPQPIILTDKVTCPDTQNRVEMGQFDMFVNGGGFFHPHPKGSFETIKIRDGYHKDNSETQEQTYFMELARSDTLIHSVNSSQENQQRNTSNLSHEEHGVQVLCSFSGIKGAPAAIVKCCVGEGQAILSSVHIEYDSQCLDSDDVHLKPVIECMKNFDMEQSVMFRYMLKSLGISINLET